MKMEINTAGVTSVMEATSFDADAEIDAAKFEVPKDVTFKETSVDAMMKQGSRK